jgi:hypothetical protein
MLTVLGGLAEFERELIRARTGEGRERGEGREDGAQAETHRPPKARGDQAPRPRRRNACRDWPAGRLRGLRHERHHPAPHDPANFAKDGTMLKIKCLAAIFIPTLIIVSAPFLPNAAFAVPLAYHETAGSYVNSDGQVVHRPECVTTHQEGETAICNDGSQGVPARGLMVVNAVPPLAKWPRMEHTGNASGPAFLGAACRSIR